MLNTVKVPIPFEPLFLKAQEHVSRYFGQKSEDPTQGTIEIYGQRYILVRAASLSVDLFELMKERYREAGEQEAIDVSRSFLFDMAHTIGKMDARCFHKKMGLTDPIERLSAGPVHFAYSGWAFVDILPESRPSPDEDFFLVYDHPFSFESNAWMQAGKVASFPVCVMNAGYSSGWCEESFGVPLLAAEILCKARGDAMCRFIMAHPSRIEQRIQEYLSLETEIARKVTSCAVPDFSKRRRVEEALRASQAENRKLAAVASRTHSSVLMAGPDGRIEWVNAGFTRLTEHSLEDVKGLGLREFLAGLDGDVSVKEWVEDQIAHCQGQRREIRQRTRSGKDLWLEVEIQPIFDEAHSLASIVAIETDVTERKAAHEDQRKLMADLEAINKELKEFAYVVSHDLKAPLRGIASLVEWITEDCKGTLNPDSQEQLDLLAGRVGRMQTLIDGILQYSRIGRAEGLPVAVDLNQLVPEIIDLISPPSHVTITVSRTLPVITADRTRIAQVFQNLLSNAVKYMDKPQGHVTVDVTECGAFWQFAVADNGPGIEEKYFELIVGLFKTLAPQDQSDSTGIGLTVVKKIVELYGGRIWVESKVGSGTTFFFTLPKTLAAAACQPAEAAGAEAATV
jgi:PAS domain S-box-containing protein